MFYEKLGGEYYKINKAEIVNRILSDMGFTQTVEDMIKSADTKRENINEVIPIAATFMGCQMGIHINRMKYPEVK